MAKSTYTKDHKYVCDICGKTVEKWNKYNHNKTRYHKMIKFCKDKMEKMIKDYQIKSKLDVWTENT